jgi:hypothetical protein
VLVFVVLAGLAVVVIVPFMRMGLFVGVRMRVTVAMSMIMSSMAVVPEASHADQVHSQTQATDNK